MPKAGASVYKIGVEKLLEELQSKREPRHKQQFQIAVIGRTGTGKSSLINSLGGRKIAPVGNYEPVTAKVESYSFTLGKAQLSIVDTPGIGADEQEERYLDDIRQQVEQVDSFLFVSTLSESRVSGDEKRAIKLISEKLGSQVWERSMIVFTFSDYVEPSEYAIALEKRTELLRKVIAKYAGVAIANNVSAVAVDNKKKEIIFLSRNSFPETSQLTEKAQESSKTTISSLLESLHAEDAQVFFFSGHGFPEASQLTQEAQESSKTKISLLTELLWAEDSQVRAAAALALGTVGNENTIPFLYDLLAANQKPEIRAAAALALGKIGDESAVPVLCDLLAADQDPEVRRSAAEALGMIGSQEK